MTFIAPGRLWLLLGVVAMAIAYIVLQRQRSKYAVRFTNVDLLDTVAPERPGWRRHVPAAAFLLGCTALVVGFAQPATEREVPKERATIIMAIDTSLSMEATDVRPSRIGGAKEAAIDFVENLPEKINLGLVSFHGVATVRVPPTTNHGAVMSAINALDLGEATAIGEAVFASLDTLESVVPDETGTLPPSRIVLMSDGETTTGRPDSDAIEAAQQAAVPVWTIAFGTDRGEIRIPQDPFPIPVPVNRDALQIMASETGGEFFTAESTEELAGVYQDIGSSVGFETEKLQVTHWFTGLGALFMAIAGFLSLLWFSRLP